MRIIGCVAVVPEVFALTIAETYKFFWHGFFSMDTVLCTSWVLCFLPMSALTPTMVPKILLVL